MSVLVPIIGMEVHVQLKTKSKMFSSAPTSTDAAPPNTTINEVDLAHPGTLPVPNSEAIRMAVMIGKALGCTIRPVSKFDRKHYFYPDLPKGYQISQYDEPIAEHGHLDLFFPLEDNIRDAARIGIERAHLEEDTAKSFHTASGETLIDFNRAGTPLVEIVTQPDFKSALEAKIFCQELQLILRTLGVSDADMEKAHMRCEANVSVQLAGSFEIVDGRVLPLGGAILNHKVEVKNINSFKAVERAIDFEIARQTALIEAGEAWGQQTRGWNEDTGETVLQRIKETAADYRYFPEPDIPPFEPMVIAGDVRIPELPIPKRLRFREEYGFSYADAALLTNDRATANFTEAVMSELVDWVAHEDGTSADTDTIREDKKVQLAKLAGNWITNKLFGELSANSKHLSDLAVSAENFAELITLLYTDKITATNAQQILSRMVASETDIDPTHIMEEEGLGKVSDEGMIAEIVERIIADHPVQVAEYKAGKEAVLQFLLGMCMRASEGKVDPGVVMSVLKDNLN
jgi:aspartyl-tRNA(Asn)/glutamyl-tRNA(Gln) amidotransferase subunit B